MARGKFSLIPPPKYPNMTPKQAKAAQRHDRVRILQGKIFNLNKNGINEFHELLSERLRDAGLIKEPVSKEDRDRLIEKLQKSPWLNMECLNLLDEKAQLLKEWKANQCPKNFQALEACRSALKEELVKLRSFWVEQMNSFDHFADMDDLPLDGSRTKQILTKNVTLTPSSSSSTRCTMCPRIFLTPMALREHVKYAHRAIDPNTVKEMPHMKAGRLPTPVGPPVRPRTRENFPPPKNNSDPFICDPYMKFGPTSIPFGGPDIARGPPMNNFLNVDRPFVLPEQPSMPQPYIGRAPSPGRRYDISPRNYAVRDRSPEVRHRMSPVPMIPRDRSPERYQRPRKRSRSPQNAYPPTIDEDSSFYNRHSVQRPRFEIDQSPEESVFYKRERRGSPSVPFNAPRASWQSCAPLNERRNLVKDSATLGNRYANHSGYPDFSGDRAYFPGPGILESNRYDRRPPVDLELERDSLIRRSSVHPEQSRREEYPRRPYF